MAHRDYGDRILREQVRLAMQQLPMALIATQVVAFVLVAASWGVVAGWKSLVWISMVLAGSLGGTLLYVQFVKVRDDLFNGGYWRDLYLARNLITGLVWGASAFIIFPSMDHPGVIFLFFLVIATLSAATTLPYSSLELGPATWAGPAVLSYVLLCCREGGELGYTIGLMGVLFLFSIIIFGFKQTRFISSGIVLRFENLDLLEEVKRINERLSREIAERKLAQKTLEESEERFRLVFRTSPDAIGLHRLSDGMFIEINESFTKITGYTCDDVMGKTTLEVDIWRDLIDRERFRASLESSGFVENMEAEFRAKDGRILTGLMSARILRINHEEMVLNIARDITGWKKTEEEKKRLEAELSFVQKMESVGRLAGGVAHDFNNMLSVIIGCAEMAMHCGVSDEGLRQNLHQIIQAAQHSAELTQQLLAFASKQPISPKIADLNETISGMLLLLRRLIGEDIGLLWMPGNDLPKVRIDPRQVDQVVLNLVVNARDAILGVGDIIVRTESLAVDEAARTGKPELAAERYAVLTVSDSGVGMSKEIREKIFEPFFTTKELGKGTGLGLSTVYGIVKQNNGFIDIESQPGKGATFKIHLPAFEKGAGAAPEKKAPESRPTGTETILLVEDNEAVLELSKSMLEMMGYTVLASAGPVRALGIAETYPGEIDLLISDVIMPEMNGRDLAEKLRNIRSGLKSLYMSGYTANAISDRGIFEEKIHFIQKPFGIGDLALKVREALDCPDCDGIFGR